MTDFSLSSLIAGIVALYVLNYVVAIKGLRDESRQEFVKRAGPPTGGLSTKALIGTAILTAVIVGFITIGGPVVREAIGGGYLVMQSAALALNVDAFLRWRAILRPGAAEGRVVFSVPLQNEVTAARSLGMALFCGIMAWLVWSIALAVGTFFLFAMAAGHYRRARQITRAGSIANA